MTVRSAAAPLALAIALALTFTAAAGLCPPPPPTSGEIPRLRYADLLCPTAPACPADLTGDTHVNVFDLLTYLDLWFAFDAAADLDGSSAVDVFDLLQYLDLWFNGCP